MMRAWVGYFITGVAWLALVVMTGACTKPGSSDAGVGASGHFVGGNGQVYTGGDSLNQALTRAMSQIRHANAMFRTRLPLQLCQNLPTQEEGDPAMAALAGTNADPQNEPQHIEDCKAFIAGTLESFDAIAATPVQDLFISATPAQLPLTMPDANKQPFPVRMRIDFSSKERRILIDNEALLEIAGSNPKLLVNLIAHELGHLSPVPASFAASGGYIRDTDDRLHVDDNAPARSFRYGRDLLDRVGAAYVVYAALDPKWVLAAAVHSDLLGVPPSREEMMGYAKILNEEGGTIAGVATAILSGPRWRGIVVTEHRRKFCDADEAEEDVRVSKHVARWNASGARTEVEANLFSSCYFDFALTRGYETANAYYVRRVFKYLSGGTAEPNSHWVTVARTIIRNAAPEGSPYTVLKQALHEWTTSQLNSDWAYRNHVVTEVGRLLRRELRADEPHTAFMTLINPQDNARRAQGDERAVITTGILSSQEYREQYLPARAP